jgi:hypothetical protein
MPCTDYGRESFAEATSREEARFFEASLCMTLTLLEQVYDEKQLWKLLDFKESGVNKEKLKLWWKAHKKRDEARKEAERKEKEKADMKARALEAIKKALTEDEYELVFGTKIW